jgi:hypothetical protein
VARKKSAPMTIKVDGPVIVGTDSGIFKAASSALGEAGIKKARTRTLLTVLVEKGEKRFIESVHTQLNTNQARIITGVLQVV